MKHICHADGCDKEVAPKLLMCYKHWKMVPKITQTKIWLNYREGQEIDKKPSKEYIEVMHEAISAVAKKEGLISENT